MQSQKAVVNSRKQRSRLYKKKMQSTKKRDRITRLKALTRSKEDEISTLNSELVALQKTVNNTRTQNSLLKRYLHCIIYYKYYASLAGNWEKQS